MNFLPSRIQREALAAILAAFATIPLAFALIAGLADGALRSQDAPIISMVGTQRFEELMRTGGEGFPHYVGQSRRAPDFSLPRSRGGTFSLSQARGRTLVLNFWSMTCPPCLEEMPTLETLANRVANRWSDVDVIAINTDATWEEAAPIVERPSALIHLQDADREVTHALFGTHLYPETWIIDPEGVIRFRYDGAYDWSAPVVLDVINRFR